MAKQHEFAVQSEFATFAQAATWIMDNYAALYGEGDEPTCIGRISLWHMKVMKAAQANGIAAMQADGADVMAISAALAEWQGLDDAIADAKLAHEARLAKAELYAEFDADKANYRKLASKLVAALNELDNAWDKPLPRFTEPRSEVVGTPSNPIGGTRADTIRGYSAVMALMSELRECAVEFGMRKGKGSRVTIDRKPKAISCLYWRRLRATEDDPADRSNVYRGLDVSNNPGFARNSKSAYRGRITADTKWQGDAALAVKQIMLDTITAKNAFGEADAAIRYDVKAGKGNANCVLPREPKVYFEVSADGLRIVRVYSQAEGISEDALADAAADDAKRIDAADAAVSAT